MAREATTPDAVSYMEVTTTTGMTSETKLTLTMLTDNSSTGSRECSVGVNSALEEIHVIRSVGWGVPILVTLTVLSCATIAIFIHTMVAIRRTVPYSKRRVFLIRLFALFPVFSVTSLAGFYVPKASLITNWAASLYLATTLYTFVLLIVDYYGGTERMKEHVEGLWVSLSAPPLTCCCPCLPKINFNMKNCHRFRLLVLQTAYIRPLCVFLAAVLWADGLYKPSVIGADSAYIYLNVFSMVSSLVAVYGLSVIYNATHDQLQHFMISVKFASIKCVLILTNAQNLLISILIANDVIPCVGPLDSASRGELIYNMLVIFEMFVFALCFKIYYRRWLTKHENRRNVSSGYVGDDINGIKAKMGLEVEHESDGDRGEEMTRLEVDQECADDKKDLEIEQELADDRMEKTNVNGSISNVSKTGSIKSETIV